VNRDVEILKLELAGNSYEATLQTCVSIAFGVLVSLLVFDITLFFQLRIFDVDFMLALFSTTAAAPAVILFYSWKRYKSAIVKLDQHVLRLNMGDFVPSLKELFS
jgi:hypothetical protein